MQLRWLETEAFNIKKLKWPIHLVCYIPRLLKSYGNFIQRTNQLLLFTILTVIHCNQRHNRYIHWKDSVRSQPGSATFHFTWIHKGVILSHFKVLVHPKLKASALIYCDCNTKTNNTNSPGFIFLFCSSEERLKQVWNWLIYSSLSK